MWEIQLRICIWLKKQRGMLMSKFYLLAFTAAVRRPEETMRKFIEGHADIVIKNVNSMFQLVDNTDQNLIDKKSSMNWTDLLVNNKYQIGIRSNSVDSKVITISDFTCLRVHIFF